MESIEEKDEMNVRTHFVRCLILISACKKPGKKNSACQKSGKKNGNNWQGKSSKNIFKSDIKEWEKAGNSTDI